LFSLIGEIQKAISQVTAQLTSPHFMRYPRGFGPWITGSGLAL
jgi:hypothetical protein